MDKSSTDRHWSRRAASELSEAEVNIEDTCQRDLELDFILDRLSSHHRMLEVGCGNGHVTGLLREEVRFVDAFDYSEEMVERAKRIVGERNNRFFQDNLLEPEHVRPPYDAVLCVRVLINLRDLAEQRTAVQHMAGWLETGGKLVLVEGYRDGFEQLNALRRRIELDDIVPASINVYSALAELRETLDYYFEIEASFHTGLYDFLTRVVYPCLVGSEAASGPSEFHHQITPLVRSYQVRELEPLARVRGLSLIKR